MREIVVGDKVEFVGLSGGNLSVPPYNSSMEGASAPVSRRSVKFKYGEVMRISITGYYLVKYLNQSEGQTSLGFKRKDICHLGSIDRARKLLAVECSTNEEIEKIQDIFVKKGWWIRREPIDFSGYSRLCLCAEDVDWGEVEYMLTQRNRIMIKAKEYLRLEGGENE